MQSSTAMMHDESTVICYDQVMRHITELQQTLLSCRDSVDYRIAA